jgi:hypothetical protein
VERLLLQADFWINRVGKLIPKVERNLQFCTESPVESLTSSLFNSRYSASASAKMSFKRRPRGNSAATISRLLR